MTREGFAIVNYFAFPTADDPIESGDDIRTVQELLGRKDVRTTMIDTHVLNRGGKGGRSPADLLTAGPDEFY